MNEDQLALGLRDLFPGDAPAPEPAESHAPESEMAGTTVSVEPAPHIEAALDSPVSAVFSSSEVQPDFLSPTEDQTAPAAEGRRGAIDGSGVEEESISAVADVRTWRQELIRGLLVALVVIGAIALVGGSFAIYDVRLLPIYVGAYAGLVVVAFWPRVSYAVRATVVLILAYGLGVLGLSQGGLSGDGRVFMLVFPFLAVLFIGRRVAIVALVLSIVTMGAFGWLFANRYLPIPEEHHLYTASPVDWFSSTLIFLMVGIVLVVSQDYLVPRLTAALAQARSLAQQLRSHRSALEERSRALESANDALARRAAHLKLGLHVGQVAGQGLNVDAFAAHAVAAIRDQLDLDHVAVYLLSTDGTYAILHAAEPNVDEMWLAHRRRVPLSSAPLLQRCVATCQPCTTWEVDSREELPANTTEDDFLLPGVRWALALPMIARDAVIGLITVQSLEPTAFHDEDVSSLLLITDQVAVAVSHALLAQELRARLDQMEALQRHYVREAWGSFMSGWQTKLYEYEQPGVPSLGDQPLPEVARVLADPQLAVLSGADASAPSALVSPISLRDQVIGVLGLHDVEGRTWTRDDVDVVTAVIEQMGLLLDNARLFEEARERAAQERKAREVSARMRETLDVETVLRTAIDEMYEALGLEELVIRLADTTDGPASARSRGGNGDTDR